MVSDDDVMHYCYPKCQDLDPHKYSETECFERINNSLTTGQLGKDKSFLFNTLITNVIFRLSVVFGINKRQSFSCNYVSSRISDAHGRINVTGLSGIIAHIHSTVLLPFFSLGKKNHFAVI